MMKEKYERTQLEITEFKSKDVIITSGEDQILDPPKARYMAPIR